MSLNESVAAVLGFNPTKPNNPDSAVLREVISEIQAERREQAKAIAKEQITQIVKQSEEIAKLESEFNGRIKKMQEELNKRYQQIVKILNAEVSTEEPEEVEPQSSG